MNRGYFFQGLLCFGIGSALFAASLVVIALKGSSFPSAIFGMGGGFGLICTGAAIISWAFPKGEGIRRKA